MASRKCDQCGRFCNRLYDVPCNPGFLGIDRGVCVQCRPWVAVGVTPTLNGGEK